MRADHEEALVADLGDAAVVLGADVHGDAFADVAIGADDESRRAAAISHRLRRRAERGERIDHGARADRGVAGDMDMRDEPAAVAERDMGADDAIRTDRHVVSDRRPAFDPRRGIDHARAHASLSMAPTSASATIWPATLASPRYHHMFAPLGDALHVIFDACRRAAPACGIWPCRWS